MSTFLWMATAEAKNEASFWLPVQASTLSGEVDYTFYFIYWVSIVFFVILMGAMLWFAFAYKRKGDDDKTADLKGSHKLEFAWSVFPSFLLIAMFVMGFKTYIKSVVPPADGMEIRVEGAQWIWTYRYPRFGIELGAEDSLVVPVNEPVRLQMNSRDVLHSYYVPDFRIKKDVLPNRYTSLWFNANDLYSENDGEVYQKVGGKKRTGSESLLAELDVSGVLNTIVKRAKKEGIEKKAEDIKYGVHQVFCTEYCGADHSRMLSSIVVLEREDFDLWVRGTTSFDPYTEFSGEGAEAKIGEYLAGKKGCTGCHNAKEAVDGAGPSWVGLFGSDRNFTNAPSGKADEAYIRESILNPEARVVARADGSRYGIMNGGWDKVLKPKDIDAIVAYIKSLKK